MDEKESQSQDPGNKDELRLKPVHHPDNDANAVEGGNKNKDGVESPPGMHDGHSGGSFRRHGA